MNNDLISRKALKADLRQYFTDGVLDGISAKLAFNQILLDIDNAQAVPQVTVFAENADEKAVADMRAELQNVLDSGRPKGEWGKWVISEIRCPECLECFVTDFHSPEELKKCPGCGATMKGGAE